ncbi:MAG: BTAD domain-containing putative transcriptional regulator [Desulfopila sp.]
MMEPYESTISFSMPSNKFYPPHIDQSQSLLRTSLLHHQLPRSMQAKKAVVIEAQAGQGKTTLVSQFLEYNSFDYVWYQIGPEDADPVMLLASLLANFNLKFPDFQSPQLATILQEGVIGPLDFKRCANILLGDIDAYLNHDLYVVFDDLHLIAGATLTNILLEHILDTSPPRLHFVLCTRQPLELSCRVLRDSNKISYLKTSDLALNNNEIEDLFNNIFGKNITPQDAVDIHRITNGWIMGIVLASHPIAERNRFWQFPQHGAATAPLTNQEHMLDYFQDEIFDKIPQPFHISFMKLSFFSEIPVDLAVSLTGIETFGETLAALARENFFVYRLDARRLVFRLHHFFQEFLQIQAKNHLSDQEISAIYASEAEYYLQHELIEKALSCFRKAENYTTMEQLLKKHGMEFAAKNRTLTILTLLDSIPKETLFLYSWLTFYAGFLRNDYVPQATLSYYEAAKDLFVESGDETGELLCLSQMIYFHFVISGQYRIGSRLLPRAAELLRNNEGTLADTVKIVAARNIATGYCFFCSEMDTAQNYISMSSSLAARLNSRNFISSVHFIQGYINLFRGNRANFLREAEFCYSLIHDPLVGMSNKLTIYIMYLCYLSMIGDYLNFKTFQLTIQNSIDPTIVDQTIAAPYFYVWGASNLFSMGQTDKAIDLLHKGSSTITAATSHMRSQLLQWLAYGLVLRGDQASALRQIEEAATLRTDVGGPFYESFQYILIGAIYSRAGKYHEALNHFDRAMALADTIPSTFLTICALMQRSYCALLEKGPHAAQADLGRGLSLMKASGYHHFWSWEPTMMERLLTHAVDSDIESSFAAMLAHERLDISFSDDGHPIALLNFSLLDTFQLSMGDAVVCQARDLTPSQRELLGLLITAKDQRINQEQVQLELWPDNSPENARKSFDTLLTRLRKELSKAEGLQSKKYISMQKGILCLLNHKMDILRFTEAAQRGLAHSKNNDWWQAGNLFNQAMTIWKGSLPEDTFKSEKVLSYNDQLVSLFIRFTTAWALHMVEIGRTTEAINLIEKTLQVSKLEEQLVTLLYALYLNSNNPIKARHTLERYRQALARIDYSPEDIESFLKNVMQTARDMVPGKELES